MTVLAETMLIARNAAAPAETGHDVGIDEDVALFLRVATGDERAYRRLVDRHAPMVLRYAYRFLGDRGDAEEVTQEAFLRVWREASRWSPGRARFSTWLYRVTTNLCIDRKRRRVPRPMAELPDRVDGAPRADDCILADQRTARLRACLDRLSERQRSAILLCYFEGLSNREAADILNVRVKALESLLTRGRERLRQLLAEAGMDRTEFDDEPQTPYHFDR